MVLGVTPLTAHQPLESQARLHNPTVNTANLVHTCHAAKCRCAHCTGADTRTTAFRVPQRAVATSAPSDMAAAQAAGGLPQKATAPKLSEPGARADTIRCHPAQAAAGSCGSGARELRTRRGVGTDEERSRTTNSRSKPRQVVTAVLRNGFPVLQPMLTSASRRQQGSVHAGAAGAVGGDVPFDVSTLEPGLMDLISQKRWPERLKEQIADLRSWAARAANLLRSQPAPAVVAEHQLQFRQLQSRDAAIRALHKQCLDSVNATLVCRRAMLCQQYVGSAERAHHIEGVVASQRSEPLSSTTTGSHSAVAASSERRRGDQHTPRASLGHGTWPGIVIRGSKGASSATERRDRVEEAVDEEVQCQPPARKIRRLDSKLATTTSLAHSDTGCRGTIGDDTGRTTAGSEAVAVQTSSDMLSNHIGERPSSEQTNAAEVGRSCTLADVPTTLPSGIEEVARQFLSSLAPAQQAREECSALYCALQRHLWRARVLQLRMDRERRDGAHASHSTDAHAADAFRELSALRAEALQEGYQMLPEFEAINQMLARYDAHDSTHPPPESEDVPAAASVGAQPTPLSGSPGSPQSGGSCGTVEPSSSATGASVSIMPLHGRLHAERSPVASPLTDLVRLIVDDNTPWTELSEAAAGAQQALPVVLDTALARAVRQAQLWQARADAILSGTQVALSTVVSCFTDGAKLSLRPAEVVAAEAALRDLYMAASAWLERAVATTMCSPGHQTRQCASRLLKQASSGSVVGRIAEVAELKVRLGKICEGDTPGAVDDM